MKHFCIVLLFISITVTSARGQYSIGDKVADFRLKNVNGKMVALSDFKTAKGAIVIFDCNTCPYSKAYNDRIIALNKMYKDRGFPVITINANAPELSPGDSFEAMVTVAKKKKYDFPYLVDESQEVARAFGASNTPHVYVLTFRDGEYFVAYSGAIDNNTRDEKSATRKYVQEAVDALLAGKPITDSKTKAIGCGIKYRKS